MSIMQDKAKLKLAEEIKKHPELIPFEKYLTGICETEAVATKILNEDKTLAEAYDSGIAMMQDIIRQI